ncbi:hypothetical protein F0249_16925 [Vibrio sp. 03-59-1]|uniref:hypothetical protein n=1 Tax=Vibrio sp. 03-59-1 TaxID=2607607 RepID=UPI00149344E3|nr:hypothetical protein [Vibrio sp. 03-59-1]NOH85480.1 hypothetical protein [Vibrio sp. 03-59-1]
MSNKHIGYALAGVMIAALTVSSAPQEGLGCVIATENEYVDSITAKAIAKGQLSHELGSVVTANTKLETITSESESSIKTTDVLTEEVTLKSKHHIVGMQTIESGYISKNGIKKYCVRVAI